MSRRAAALAEGVSIALDALRANRVRAALTVTGMVVGVATVMTVAGLVTGVRATVLDGLDVMGSGAFAVERFDFTRLRLSELSKRPWEHAPPVTAREARVLQALPTVLSATPYVNTTADVRADTAVVREVDVDGQGVGWSDYRRGRFVEGRDFLPGEVDHAAAVVILSERLARSVLGAGSAAGAHVKLNGRPFEVVGVFRPQANVFSDTESGWAVVPYSTALRYMDADAEWLQVDVVPRPGVSQGDAMDEVAQALRAERGLRPLQPDNFALTEQDAYRELFDRTTQAFFAVILLLSSVGLVVGGIGVMAIMTISVTERTREIGVRRALGATRGDIVGQFVVESATLTLVGGGTGIVLAQTGVFLLAHLTPVPAAIPAWSALAGTAVVAAAGIVFGLYPARRAARLDVVEALRHE